MKKQNIHVLWLLIDRFLLLLQLSTSTTQNEKTADLQQTLPTDLQTIDEDDLMALSYVMEGVGSEDSCPAMLGPPAASCTPASSETATVMPSPVSISEEVVQTCVTPRKVKGVQSVLQSEQVPHRVTVKLLPYFFTKQELSSSNTEGTHKKQRLDTTRLNSLKVLVFTKFPIDSLEEKEKCWKFIKGKINDRCRASKFVLGREG